MRDLLEAGGKTDRTTDVFDAAAQNDVARLVKLIKDSPFLATTVLPNGWTPLHMAALWNASGAIAALLDAGAGINARDAQGASPLHRVLQAEEANAAMRANAILLIEKGADVNARSDYEPFAGSNTWKEHLGDMPLNRAILLNDAELVTLLLRKGARLTTRNEHRDTPLMVAVKAGKSEMIPLLIQAGADVNHRSSGGGTTLMLAVRSGNLALVQLLIAKKVDVNALNDAGKNALSAFGRQSSDEIRELLENSGATE